MESFLTNISSFPTMIFTTMTLIVAGYWLLTMVGILDLDILDFDIDLEGDSNNLHGVAAAMATLGLTGVPVAVVISIISLVAWLICYYAVYFGLFWAQEGFMRIVAGTIVGVASLAFSLPVTAQLIRPLRKVFTKLNEQASGKSLLGTTCIIRTTRVDTDFGEAECRLNGAPLLIKVRSDGKTPFARGDKAVIIEHDASQQVYQIISEIEFNQ